jgi:hypothetical protein
MGCKTTNFGCFHGNTANKGFCTVQIDLQNMVVILVLCFATLQNKLATAVCEPVRVLEQTTHFLLAEMKRVLRGSPVLFPT